MALVKFRHRIALLVALAAIALVAVTAASVVLGARAEREVSEVEVRYVPLLELNRDLEALQVAIPRTLEDAASAAEDSRLAEADRLRDQFIDRVSVGRVAIASNGGDVEALLGDFRTYYGLARSVTSALIAGESGERLADSVERMRAAQGRWEARLEAATTPDRSRLVSAFESARRTQRTAVELETAVAVVALVTMLLLSWGIVRRTMRSLRGLSLGMERLAGGDFSHEIEVATRDEFGDVAAQGNQTARRLREYRDQREHEDWIKTGMTGLAAEIAGQTDLEALGGKAMAYLAGYVGAEVAVIYAQDEPGGFRLLAARGVSGPPARFEVDDSLLGQVVRDEAVRILDGVPADYLKLRTALGDMAPRQVIAMPFAHEGRVMGLLELGLTTPLSAARLALFERVRGALGVAFRVAASQERTRGLLDQTRRQADELREAYDTLEARNRTLQLSELRLHAQQNELLQTNEELAQQSAAVEAQRSAVEAKNEALLEAHGLLEDKAAELARASRYKSEFLANMSHELRTPLNSIMILSQLLADNEGEHLDARQVEFATIIHKSGEELLTLINDVLDLAKVEAGKQEVVCERLPLAELATYVQRMFAAVAAERGLTLEVALAPGLPDAVPSDRLRVHQILKNLVSNALKFTPEGGITVELAPADPVGVDAGSGDRIAIRVRDTGIGIPEDKREHIFEAFAQADGGTSRAFGGTGLGLSIARQLARLLGGDLTVTSEVGVGSVFELTLPSDGPPTVAASASATAAAPMTPAVLAAGPPLEPSRVAATPGRSEERERLAPAVADAVADDRQRLAPGDPCFLVIEDDPHFAAVVLGLVREAGFRGLVAGSGQAGLALAERHQPQGIILDVGLPDLDGWSVMERLRASPRCRDIPVHFLTAADDAARAEQLGAVGFLSKPVAADQIRAALRQLGPRGVVLLVEADPAVRASIGELLATGGIEVEVVSTAREAIDRMRAGGLGGIVQDLALPDKAGGFELLRRIREDAAGGGLPVVVHTGLALSAEEMRRIEVHDRATLILQGEHSPERVLEETRQFLRRLGTAPPPELVDAPALDGKRVLIVDDDMRNVYSLSIALRARHLEVRTAADGQEALDELAAHPDVDAVLMDVMMPRMDGHEATRRIRAQDRFHDLPIIALTAQTMPGERQRCIDAGASDYVAKPVDVERLLSLLRVWLTDQAGMLK